MLAGGSLHVVGIAAANAFRAPRGDSSGVHLKAAARNAEVRPQRLPARETTADGNRDRVVSSPERQRQWCRTARVDRLHVRAMAVRR